MAASVELQRKFAGTYIFLAFFSTRSRRRKRVYAVWGRYIGYILLLRVLFFFDLSQLINPAHTLHSIVYLQTDINNKFLLNTLNISIHLLALCSWSSIVQSFTLNHLCFSEYFSFFNDSHKNAYFHLFTYFFALLLVYIYSSLLQRHVLCAIRVSLS